MTHFVPNLNTSMNLVSKFYKNLYGHSSVTSLILDGIDCDQLSVVNTVFLTKKFGIEENKEVVFDLNHNERCRT